MDQPPQPPKQKKQEVTQKLPTWWHRRIRKPLRCSPGHSCWREAKCLHGAPGPVGRVWLEDEGTWASTVIAGVHASVRELHLALWGCEQAIVPAPKGPTDSSGRRTYGTQPSWPWASLEELCGATCAVTQVVTAGHLASLPAALLCRRYGWRLPGGS